NAPSSIQFVKRRYGESRSVAAVGEGAWQDGAGYHGRVTLPHSDTFPRALAGKVSCPFGRLPFAGCPLSARPIAFPHKEENKGVGIPIRIRFIVSFRSMKRNRCPPFCMKRIQEGRVPRFWAKLGTIIGAHDFIAPSSLVRLSLASPKSIMHLGS